ncbi:unnamed protein product, partial [Mycena citricolor]
VVRDGHSRHAALGLGLGLGGWRKVLRGWWRFGTTTSGRACFTLGHLLPAFDFLLGLQAARMVENVFRKDDLIGLLVTASFEDAEEESVK